MAKYTLKYLQHMYKDKFVDVYGVYSQKSRCWEFTVRGVSDTPQEHHHTVEEIAAKYVDGQDKVA